MRHSQPHLLLLPIGNLELFDAKTSTAELEADREMNLLQNLNKINQQIKLSCKVKCSLTEPSLDVGKPSEGIIYKAKRSY
jgi:hypothetical protein